MQERQKKAHEIIKALEQIKGGIDEQTFFLRELLAEKICQKYGFIAAIEYLQLAYGSELPIQAALLACFKIHLNDDKKRLPDPEANLEFLQNFSENMMTAETYSACSDATIKVFLKQPQSFDKTLTWACDSQCSSATRYDRIRACVNSLHVWPSLPLESMEKLILAIIALSLPSIQKNDIYYDFVLQTIRNKHFSKEHENLILQMFYKGIDNEDIQLELIQELAKSHININSVALIRAMILRTLKNHSEHDLCLIDCMEWYFIQQNFKEAYATISKIEKPLLRLLMQAHAIKFLLEKGYINQAIDQIYQHRENIFIQIHLTGHILNLGKQEKYDEAFEFIARIPEQYHRCAEAIYSAVRLPLTEYDFHDLQLLYTLEQLSTQQELEIQIVKDIKQLAYRDAAQFEFMKKLLKNNEIEIAMNYAYQYLDNPLIVTAIIGYLESLCRERKYDKAYSIINQMPLALQKEEISFLVDYMRSVE